MNNFSDHLDTTSNKSTVAPHSPDHSKPEPTTLPPHTDKPVVPVPEPSKTAPTTLPPHTVAPETIVTEPLIPVPAQDEINPPLNATLGGDDLVIPQENYNEHH